MLCVLCVLCVLCAVCVSECAVCVQCVLCVFVCAVFVCVCERERGGVLWTTGGTAGKVVHSLEVWLPLCVPAPLRCSGNPTRKVSVILEDWVTITDPQNLGDSGCFYPASAVNCNFTSALAPGGSGCGYVGECCHTTASLLLSAIAVGEAA